LRSADGRREVQESRSDPLTYSTRRGRSPLHRKYNNQTLVTARRQQGLKGPLQNPRIELARPGITGEVSIDGLPPQQQ
jgi:hypothetical protein